jgi:hypothetical protein
MLWRWKSPAWTWSPPRWWSKHWFLGADSPTSTTTHPHHGNTNQPSFEKIPTWNQNAAPWEEITTPTKIKHLEAHRNRWSKVVISHTYMFSPCV